MRVADSRGGLALPSLALVVLLTASACSEMPGMGPTAPPPEQAEGHESVVTSPTAPASVTSVSQAPDVDRPQAAPDTAVARQPAAMGGASMESTTPPSSATAPVAATPKTVKPKAQTAGMPKAVAPRPPASAAAKPAPKAVAEDFSRLPPRTFVVHSVAKDSSHPYFGRGSQLGFSVNGVQGKALVVERGQRYVFRVDTAIQHDFYLARKGVGRGGFTLTKGVKGNFIYEGEVAFTPDRQTPDIVYYACRNHAYMGGPIFVVDAGKPFDLSRAEAEWRQGLKSGRGVSGRRPGKVSANTARQKLDFAGMFVVGSAVAKRIDASDHAEAKRLAAEARHALDAGRKAYAGKDYVKALAHADSAMKAMSRAGRLVPASVVAEDGEDTAGKEQFKVLLDGVKTYRKSYLRNRKLFAGKKGVDFPEVDLTVVDATTERASKLADAGDYRQANALLTRTQTTLTEALSAMLKSKTLSYELVFETPKQEYEYELARYQSYEELVPLAIEQRRPSKRMQGLMDKYVKEGQDIKAQALPVAAKGDYKKAILMLQGATSHIRRALRIVGVR